MPQGAADDMSFFNINHAAVDTVIFDFDGTLAELNIDFDQMRSAIGDLISRFGIDQQNLRHRYVLETIEEAGALIQKSSHRKYRSFADESRRIIESIEVEAALRGKLFSTTKGLLAVLNERNIRAGIITRNCIRAVQTVFPDISSYCTVVVCRNDVKQVKPHPEHLNLALSRLGSTANRSIMIGDHPLDIETGRNAGTMAAGVLSGHFLEEDFIRAGADLILPQASHILKLLSPPLSANHL